MYRLVICALLIPICCCGAAAQGADASASALKGASGAGKPDFIAATPLRLPIATEFTNEDAMKAMANAMEAHPPSVDLQTPGTSMGSKGDGKTSRIVLGQPKKAAKGPGDNIQLDYGNSNLPFSTARADLDTLATNEQYPYRAAGKLFFLIGNKTYICSASLIKKGIVVTAAHCVADFGKKQYYSGWQFIPGYRSGVAPFGVWSVAKAAVLTSYSDGSDDCQQKGVVCPNDVAVLVVEKKPDAQKNATYPGTNTGWFAYGWDKSGFAGRKITHVTQIGYPACLDNGTLMERNDAQGTVDANHSGNTIIGSLMCGGSSGGPWLLNFGDRPDLTGTTLGVAPDVNEVVGVTSWGSTDAAVKWMGASPFLSSNVVPLVQAACKEYPDACVD